MSDKRQQLAARKAAARKPTPKPKQSSGGGFWDQFLHQAEPDAGYMGPAKSSNKKVADTARALAARQVAFTPRPTPMRQVPMSLQALAGKDTTAMQLAGMADLSGEAQAKVSALYALGLAQSASNSMRGVREQYKDNPDKRGIMMVAQERDLDPTAFKDWDEKDKVRARFLQKKNGRAEGAALDLAADSYFRRVRDNDLAAQQERVAQLVSDPQNVGSGWRERQLQQQAADQQALGWGGMSPDQVSAFSSDLADMLGIRGQEKTQFTQMMPLMMLQDSIKAGSHVPLWQDPTYGVKPTPFVDTSTMMDQYATKRQIDAAAKNQAAGGLPQSTMDRLGGGGGGTPSRQYDGTGGNYR